MKIAFAEAEVSLNVPANPDRMSEVEFTDFCLQNPELNVEREADGTVVFMSPILLGGSLNESRLHVRLAVWVDDYGQGSLFTSNAGFMLPNGAVRSPDASWISAERMQSLPASATMEFPRICPDFVAEMRSHTDSFRRLQSKMQEYINCGCKLAFLIDPIQQKAWVYRPGEEIYQADFSEKLSGYDVLPGFELDLNIFR